jgi:hypothetical protein
MKANWSFRFIVPLITDLGEFKIYPLVPLSPGKHHSDHHIEDWVGPKTRFINFVHLVPPPGFEPRVVQSVA